MGHLSLRVLTTAALLCASVGRVERLLARGSPSKPMKPPLAQ